MKLPVLISIPHGGVRIPKEVEGLVKLSPADVFEASDPFAGEIFRLGDRVLATIDTSVSRAIVDVDRPRDHAWPKHSDGALKNTTAHGHQVYETLPDAALKKELLKAYYDPYQEQLHQGMAIPGLKLAVTCHTMAPVGPAHAADAGVKRPMIYLSTGDGTTAPPEAINHLAECMARAFRLPRKTVLTEGPLLSKHHSPTYGTDEVPWIEVHVNQFLYLDSPAFGPNGPTNDPKRLKELNWSWDRALHLYFRGNAGAESADTSEAVAT